MASTGDEKPLEEVFADRLAFEHKLIADRMTWLLTLDGFLIAASALLVANHDRFAGSPVLGAALLTIGTLGAASNLSCSFSNYWGSRAIRETAATLVTEWEALGEEDKAARIGRMRLYGRDPRACLKPDRSPPSTWFHPWNLVPAAFTAFFTVLPFASRQVSGVADRLSWGVTSLSLTPFAALLLVLALDARFHLRRYAFDLARRHGPAGAARSRQWRTVRPWYYAERVAVREWLLRAGPDDVAPVRRWRWSVIPPETYAAYVAARQERRPA